MKDLQMLIDKWKKEADELDAVMKDVDFTMFAQLLGTVRRLRFCAVDVELLIGKMANNELSPQLNKHDVSGQLPLTESDFLHIAQFVRREGQHYNDKELWVEYNSPA